jgi:hypothetical protein
VAPSPGPAHVARGVRRLASEPASDRSAIASALESVDALTAELCSDPIGASLRSSAHALSQSRTPVDFGAL